MSITVYSKKGCMNCEKLKMLLTRKKINFIENQDMNQIMEIAKQNSFSSIPIMEVKHEEVNKYFQYDDSVKYVSQIIAN